MDIVGSLRDRVACSASDRQGSNLESCVWRAVSSHHLQEVSLILYLHKGGLKLHSFHFSLDDCCNSLTRKESEEIHVEEEEDEVGG